MKLGYARCSTLDQNLDWQIDALTKEGCDRIFQEKFTGTRKDRPELLRMMDMLLFPTTYKSKRRIASMDCVLCFPFLN